MQVDILEAKSKWFELVQRAAAGEEVVIVEDGSPVAKLVSAETDAVRCDDEREATNRKLDAIVAEMHRLPDRSDAFDPLEWDKWGLPK